MFAGAKFEDANRVRISGCSVPPCKLKRRTKASVEQKFVPDQDCDNIVNSVNAAVLGVPLPFVGVDGTSACENLFNADGTSAGCTLKKGVEYTYKREFPILQIYPTVRIFVYFFARFRASLLEQRFLVEAMVIKRKNNETTDLDGDTLRVGARQSHDHVLRGPGEDHQLRGAARIFWKTI
ncbi:hypothetical protein WH47_00899 [Habropoda laboriosa]|uniref:MD-2-related lipid-recognition domain-containing protein n=1 Tax=Habropoda laboriosa TaxID=597456 RepID=A0A0L7R739_9HYME|nr:hypothetical protein WH47_00899 [Habropoda laboriosa]